MKDLKVREVEPLPDTNLLVGGLGVFISTEQVTDRLTDGLAKGYRMMSSRGDTGRCL